MDSILEQVRREASRDALQAARANEQDSWFEEGRVKGWQESEVERKRWGWFCFICGIALSALLYGLTS
jgi:hypothetical protein